MILTKNTSKQVTEVVDHFFRHQSGTVIASLTKTFGTGHLNIIEDSFQEALFKAMQVWPYKGVPKNPTGWILTVSKNKVIDILRRNQKMTLQADVKSESTNEESIASESFSDNLIEMMFACCHPMLSSENQIILTLKILCGLSTQEISRALLKKEDAIAKAYTRAKAKLKSADAHLDVPEEKELSSRLDVLLKVIYLVFNEGYKSSGTDKLIKWDLCEEAIRLCSILLENKQCEQPKAHALMALMCFHYARFSSRIDENGELVELRNQDRKLWDQKFISTAKYHFHRGTSGINISEYYLQAGIAGFHCMAESYEKTDWTNILRLYEMLFTSSKSSIVALNRIVPFSHVHGAKKALQELGLLQEEKTLQNYYLYYAIKAELLKEIGSNQQAIETMEKAILLTTNVVEKKHLEKKILLWNE